MVESNITSTAAQARRSPPSGDMADASDGVPRQYDLLLAKLSSAEQELLAVNKPGRNRHLEEASGIVFDLLYALDYRRGGELVPRLAALYGYIGNELLNVGRTGDRTQLGHIRDMIMTLKQSWCDGEAA